jgi:hypothetical protein
MTSTAVMDRTATSSGRCQRTTGAAHSRPNASDLGPSWNREIVKTLGALGDGTAAKLAMVAPIVARTRVVQVACVVVTYPSGLLSACYEPFAVSVAGLDDTSGSPSS